MIGVTGTAIGVLHTMTGWLLAPTILGLLALLLFALIDAGVLVGERFSGIRRLRELGDSDVVLRVGRRRIDRSDAVARLGPMLGLMGTLIPLGPGLEALAMGDVAQLARQMTVAFDTTVVGLAAGVLGFAVGRLRRRWYEEAIDAVE